MYSITPPAVAPQVAYTATVKTVRAKKKRKPYEAATKAVVACCVSFDGLASNNQLHLANASSFEMKQLETGSMERLYDGPFTKNRGAAPIRELIKTSARNSKCPYCGEGTVTELDHYLPKSGFAAITVHPSNLVPCCGDCNREKKAYKPSSTDPAVLHPYFDDAFSTQWLAAKVCFSPDGLPNISYSIELSSPDAQLESRLNAHMDVFALKRRFGVWGAQALSNFTELVRTPSLEMNLFGARRHLELTAIQQSGGQLNSWEGVAHRAMSRSDRYLRRFLGLV